MSKRSRASAFRLCVGLFASAGANEISSTSFAISSTSIDSHNRLIDAVVGADLVIPTDKDSRALVEWDDDCQDDPNYLSPRFAAPCVFHKVVDCKGFARVGYTDDEVFDLITHCPVSCKVHCGTWTRSPTSSPTSSPTETHSDVPSVAPSANPTVEPSPSPSHMPTSYPSTLPTARPSSAPTSAPSHAPTFSPSAAPSGEPSRSPTQYPSAMPSALPTSKPSASPTSSPSSSPSASPTAQPSSSPSASPTSSPSSSPSASPTFHHSSSPSHVPTSTPSSQPTLTASDFPSGVPTISSQPSAYPTDLPSGSPSSAPSRSPIIVPVSSQVFEMSLSPVTSYLDTVAYTKLNQEINDMIMGNIILPDNTGSRSRSMMEMSTVIMYQNLASYRVLLEEEQAVEEVSGGEGRRLKSYQLRMSIQKTLLVSVPVLEVPRDDGLEYDPSLIPDSQAIDDAIEHLFLDQFQQVALQLRLRVSRNPALSKVTEIEFHGFETEEPTLSPTMRPSERPSVSSVPSSAPTSSPTLAPSEMPTFSPTAAPSSKPSRTPTQYPSAKPTVAPSSEPSRTPTQYPSAKPTVAPSSEPSRTPTQYPSAKPSPSPTATASSVPSSAPTSSPTLAPSEMPTFSPTAAPSSEPSRTPTQYPSAKPSPSPTATASSVPSSAPTSSPTLAPTKMASNTPSALPTVTGSNSPSSSPTITVSEDPTAFPTETHSSLPSQRPSPLPTDVPSLAPSFAPKEIVAFGTSFDFHFDGVTSYLDQTSFDAFNEAMNDVVLKQLRAEMSVPAEVMKFEIAFTFFYQVLGGEQIHNLVEEPVKRARNLKRKKSVTKKSNKNDMIQADSQIGSAGVGVNNSRSLVVRMQMVAHFYVDQSVDESSFVRPEKKVLDDALSLVLRGGSMRFVVATLRQSSAIQYNRLREISLVGFNSPPTKAPATASPTTTENDNVHGATASQTVLVPSMQPIRSPIKQTSELSSMPSVANDIVVKDNAVEEAPATPQTGWVDTCQDDPTYISTIIPNARCDNFREVDCFAFLSIGVSLNTVSALVNACPRSCNIECGNFAVFGVATEGTTTSKPPRADSIPTPSPSTFQPTSNEPVVDTFEPSGKPSSAPTTSKPTVAPSTTDSPTQKNRSTSRPTSTMVVVDDYYEEKASSLKPSGEPSSAPTTSKPTIAPSTRNPTRMPSAVSTTSNPTLAPTTLFVGTEMSADDVARDDIKVVGDSVGKGKSMRKGAKSKKSSKKASKETAEAASNRKDTSRSDFGDGVRDFIVADATAATKKDNPNFKTRLGVQCIAIDLGKLDCDQFGLLGMTDQEVQELKDNCPCACNTDINCGEGEEEKEETHGTKPKGSKKASKETVEDASYRKDTSRSDSDDGGRSFIVAGATAATSGSQSGLKESQKKGMMGLLVVVFIVFGAMYAKKRCLDAPVNGKNDVGHLPETIVPEPSGEGEEVLLEDIVETGLHVIPVDACHADEKA